MCPADGGVRADLRQTGQKAICVDRVTGDYPITAQTLEIGVRRPLAIGAGSMALLAWAPLAEHDAVIETTLGRAAEAYPRLTRAVIQEAIRQAREQGYVVLLDVVIEKLGGIACPIYDPRGNVIAAISVTALRERIADRESQLAQALLHEQAHIRKMLEQRRQG